MFKFKNDQEAAYRKLQTVLNEAMKNGEDEYSDEDETAPSITTNQGKKVPKFRLPKRLRGWMFLERSQIPSKEIPAILNQTKDTNLNNLQAVLVESYSDKIMRDIDSRQHSHSYKKVHYSWDVQTDDASEEAFQVNDDDFDWTEYGWYWDDIQSGILLRGRILL